MMNMAAKTPLGLKLFCVVVITQPEVLLGAEESSTIAPMIAIRRRRAGWR